jgi:chromosome segregation ATPase
MRVVFIILLASIIFIILFIPRYPIECYEEVGKANNWGGVPKTEADYEKMEAEMLELKEQLRKKDQVLKDRMGDAERQCRDSNAMVTKRSNELEASEEEARKKKDECEFKSMTCLKDAQEAKQKIDELGNKLKSAEECCDKQKLVTQEANQQIGTLKNELGILKLRIETLTSERKNAEAMVNMLKTAQETPAAKPAPQ